MALGGNVSNEFTTIERVCGESGSGFFLRPLEEDLRLLLPMVAVAQKKPMSILNTRERLPFRHQLLIRSGDPELTPGEAETNNGETKH